MRPTKIIKSIDHLGRFKIPKELQISHEIKSGSLLNIYQKRKSIVLELEEHKCIFCSSSENIHIFNDKFICSNCIKAISNDIMSLK